MFGVKFIGRIFGIKFITRQFSFIGGGIFDSISTHIFKTEVSFGKMCAQKISNCEPWTDHYSPKAINDIKDALKRHDFKSARALAAICSNEEASTYCTNLLEAIIDFLAAGVEIEIEMIPFME